MHTLLKRSAVGTFATLAMIGSLVACSPADSGGSEGSLATDTKTTTDVTVQMAGAAVPYYAPLYAAVEQGYFKQNGLNVEFAYADGASIVQNVAAGNVDFGFPNGDSVITARGKGIDVKVVHTTYQQGIGALLFNKETSGISTVADLEGKTIAVTSLSSPNYAQLQAMLQSADLSVDDVNLKVVGSGAIVSSLQNGEVDAIVFSRLRYYALQSAGFPVGQILSDKFLPSFGNILVTSSSYLKENPDLVKGFNKALNEGIKYVSENPAKAVEMSIAKYAPTFSGQEASITKVIEDVYIAELWQSEATEEHGLGYGEVGLWQKAINAQAEFGLIEEPYDAESLVVQPNDI
ncbi:ABC transporter substrate-binding protein [Arthrobacter pigmenti]